MAHLTRLVALSFSLALLVLAVHAEDAKFDTPENTVNTFLSAMSQQDNAAMLRCLIADERESCKSEFSGKPIEGLKITGRVKSTSKDGIKATAVCEITIAFGGESEVSQLLLVLWGAKDHWLISWQESQRATNIEYPEQRRRQHAENARLILTAVKDRARLIALKKGRNPQLVSELGFTEQDLAEPYWVMKEALRLSRDGTSAIAEIESREYDDLVLIRFGIEYKKKEFTILGIEEKSTSEERAKEIEKLLGTVRDYVCARYEAEKGIIPTEIIKKDSGITTYDLVSDHWVVRNEVAGKGNVVTLTADSLSECTVATLEFDVSKGVGEVKIAEAYDKGYLKRQQKAQTEMAEIRKALDTYRLDNGDYPDSLEAIADQFNGKVPVDPFTKQPYAYERSGKEKKQYIQLTCLGRDGKEGGRWMPDKDIVIRFEFTQPEDEGSNKDGGDGSKGRFR